MKALLSIFTCVWALSCVGPIWAAPLPDGERREAAEAFKQGQTAFEQGEFDAALAHFERALEVGRHDAVRFNVAVCLERLGLYDQAVAQYDQAALSNALDEATRERAREAAERARAQLGRLTIENAEPGSRVQLDQAPLCTLPCTPRVNPGQHEVAVTWVGGEHREVVTVASGEEVRVRVPARAPAPAPARAAPARVEPMPVEPQRRPAPISAEGAPSLRPGMLTWLGAALAVGGAVGTTYFGLRTEALRDDYDQNPSAGLADQGDASRNLTNLSLGVGIVGAALVGLDLLLLQPDSSEREGGAYRRALRADAPLTWSF
jgi:tetratricopeptide (TPR) repeat protein